ncbi:MAG TPA: cyclic-phosphate processing receiver domain-containing protein [Tepidisphaeraceae bacterium]|nr:cyclic-phosphate processing receiver domain-containing protein [Tepidisphaeraceae bacterium]
MSGFVAILEDNTGRIEAMKACLSELLPGVQIVVHLDAKAMIDWLGQHLGDVILISLDHDLPIQTVDGKSVDCGTGRQVADYLASMPPTCPVIVHSSNDRCAAGMFFALKDAGWPCGRIYPSDDLAWIASAWADRVRQYLREGWINSGS